MSWGLLLRRHAMTIWQRLKTKWLTRQLERKQQAARGIAGKKYPNQGNPIRKAKG